MAWRWGRGRERAFVTVLSGETVRSVGICESTFETLEAEGGNIFKMRGPFASYFRPGEHPRRVLSPQVKGDVTKLFSLATSETNQSMTDGQFLIGREGTSHHRPLPSNLRDHHLSEDREERTNLR